MLSPEQHKHGDQSFQKTQNFDSPTAKLAVYPILISYDTAGNTLISSADHVFQLQLDGHHILTESDFMFN